MLRYVILWSDNILELTEKVNKILEGGCANVVGGLTISQTHNNIKFYQSLVIDEVLNPNTMYSASAIKSPLIDMKDSFEVV